MQEFEIYEFKSLSGKEFDSDVQKRVNYVLSRVLSWYPDKIIESLNKNHRKFAEETLVKTRRLAGYDDNKVFFEDFGFTYINKNLVRKEQNLQKQGLKNILTSDDRLSKFYENSLSKNILLNHNNIFSSEFEMIFKDVMKENSLNYTIEDVYKIFASEELKWLMDFSNKSGKVYCIPCNEVNKRYQEYLKIPTWDGINGIVNRQLEENNIENEIVENENQLVENDEFDEAIVEEILDDLYNTSKPVVYIFKGREKYLYHPSVFTASALDFEARSSKGKLWRVLDYSCFNEVRVALYFLSRNIEIGQIFSNCVIKKAKDFGKKYLNNDKALLFYNAMNNLEIDEEEFFNSQCFCKLDVPIGKTEYKVFSVQKDTIDIFYKLMDNSDSFYINSNYGYLNMNYKMPVNKKIFLDYRKDYITVSEAIITFEFINQEDYEITLDFGQKYSFSFVMDGIKEEADRYVFLCHYGILPNKDAKLVLLNTDENTFNDSFDKAYNEAYPDDDLRNIINDIFADYDPYSELDIDNLEGYDETPAYQKNTIVKVKFDSGGAYDYNCKLDVAIGSRVYVSGAKVNQIGTVVNIYDSELRPDYQNVIKVTGEIIDLRIKFEEEFPKLINPVNHIDKSKKLYKEKLVIERTIVNEEIKNVEIIDKINQESALEEKYIIAEALYNETNYIKAIEAYQKLENYKDSKEKVSLIKTKLDELAKEEKYQKAESLYNETEYVKALTAYQELENYKDSIEKVSIIETRLDELAKEEKYQKAENLYNETEYLKSLSIYKELGNYKDSEEKISIIETKLDELAKEEKYQKAEGLYNESQFAKALVLYKELKKYKDSEEKISIIETRLDELTKEEKYSKVNTLMKKASYKDALTILKDLDGYKDSNELLQKCNSYILEEENYKKASNLNQNAKYDEAYELVKNSNNDKNIKLSLELNRKIELYNKYKEFNYKKATIIELQNAINELKAIKEYKNVNELITIYSSQISTIEKKKSMFKLGLIIGSIVSVVTLIVVLVVTVVVPNNKYEDAISRINNKDYDSAEEILISLDGHKDSEDILLIVYALKELEDDLEKGVNDLLELGVKVKADYKSKFESNLSSIEFVDKYYLKEHNLEKYNFITWELKDYIVELNSSNLVNLKLEGIYDEKEFNISYELDGGFILEDSITKYKYGNTVDLPFPYKEGHEFIGWDSNNDNVFINKDNNINNKSYGDVVLTANYKANEYKVTFDTNGGAISNGQTIVNLTITYGLGVELSEPTKIGYKFVGWYCDNVKLNVEAYNIAKDCIVEARWEIVNYKIEYIGDDVNVENPVTITYEDVVILKPVEKIGHSFIGWKYNGEIYEKVELSEISSDITIEALFEPKQYTITLDPNGGVSNLKVNINYYVEGNFYTTQTLKPGENVELLYLTNGDRQISGWYLDEEYKEKFDERIPLENDISLYGYYTYTSYINPTSYTSGRNYTMTCPIGGSVNTIYIRAKVSGSFTIYYKNASTTNDYNGDKETYISITNRTSGTTYVSKEILKSKSEYRSVTINCLQGDEISISCWKVNSNGIGWDLNIYFTGYNSSTSKIIAAEEINKINVKYGSKINLPTPTKEGCTFLGWYLNDELYNDELYVITDDIKLVAKWKEN